MLSMHIDTRSRVILIGALVGCAAATFVLLVVVITYWRQRMPRHLAGVSRGPSIQDVVRQRYMIEPFTKQSSGNAPIHPHIDIQSVAHRASAIESTNSTCGLDPTTTPATVGGTRVSQPAARRDQNDWRQSYLDRFMRKLAVYSATR